MKRYLNYYRGLVYIVLSLNCSQIAFASNEIPQTDIRSLSVGGINSLSRELLNPAAISFLENGEVGLSTVNRFGMKELSTYGVYGVFLNKWLDGGIQFSTYGYEEYRLTQGEINLAKRITSGLSIGVQFGCLHENSFLKEANEMYFVADPGLYWKINSQFDLAFVSKNLLSTSNFLKPAFYAGLGYRPIRDFHILAEGGFVSEKQSYLSLGIEYEILSVLTFRCGVRTDTPNPAIGAAWRWGKWRVDIVFLLHNQLDLSSGIGLSYSL